MKKMQKLWGENFGLDGDYWIFFASPTNSRRNPDAPSAAENGRERKDPATSAHRTIGPETKTGKSAR